MQTARLGNNVLTVCACCDVLIVVKNKDARAGSDEVHAQLKAHINGSRKCRAYYDALLDFSQWKADMGIAPNATGDLSSEEFVRRLRSGEPDNEVADG